MYKLRCQVQGLKLKKFDLITSIYINHCGSILSIFRNISALRVRKHTVRWSQAIDIPRDVLHIIANDVPCEKGGTSINSDAWKRRRTVAL